MSFAKGKALYNLQEILSIIELQSYPNPRDISISFELNEQTEKVIRNLKNDVSKNKREREKGLEGKGEN